MAYRLSEHSLLIAIRHLCRYGDTDVFPHLPEIAFLSECETDAVAELKKLDLDSYTPGGAVEAIAPKGRYSFRIVHQLPVLETVLFLAAVVELGSKIESYRQPSESFAAFSYRFEPNDNGTIFRADRTFKEWLHNQLSTLQKTLKIKQVVSTDISDFYARINFHRLENLLDEVAPKHGAAKYLKKQIKIIRGKQSFGLPVGGAAARLLAELALIDTDKALEDDGRVFTRFVDDFRLYLKAGENPYDALAFLAEQLGINEGLSLNAAKTFVSTRAKQIEKLKSLTSDVSDEAEGAALETITSDLYFDDDPDPEELETLKSMNLLEFLQDEVGAEAYDLGRIKVIFRALKLTKPPEAIEYLSDNFSELVGFAKEVVLLMQALEDENEGCFNELADAVVTAILSPPASSVQLIRTWLMELFVRGTIPINAAQTKALDVLSTTLDRRQLHLIRGRRKDKNFFRKNKTGLGQIPPVEQMCFVWGASCLPADEYGAWVKTIKPMFNSPLGARFLKWAEDNREKLLSRLEAPTDEHPE